MERIPILKLEDFLLVTIQTEMHDRMALALREDLGRRIVESRAEGVLLDISALDTLDTFIGRVLGGIGAMSKLLGAETVLAGMRPAVAMTLVELGLTLEGVHTALDVERGMEMLRKRKAERRRRLDGI